SGAQPQEVFGSWTGSTTTDEVVPPVARILAVQSGAGGSPTQVAATHTLNVLTLRLVNWAAMSVAFGAIKAVTKLGLVAVRPPLCAIAFTSVPLLVAAL